MWRIVLGLLTLIESSQSLNCTLWGSQSSLGDYYAYGVSHESNMINLVVNTKDNCSDIFIDVTDENKKFIVKLKPSAIQLINMTEYTYGKSNYSTFSYFFSIGNLNEGQTIYYSYFLDGQSVKTYQITAPKTQDQLQFIVYGDYDLSNVSTSTTKYLNSLSKIDNRGINLTLFLGDMAYDLETDNYSRGEVFLQEHSDYMSEIPYMLSYGNHEAGQNRTFQFVNDTFKMPMYDKWINGQYSFNAGLAHFINWDPYYEFYEKASPEQKKGLRNFIYNDLLEANKSRSERPWIIVFSHYTYYCSYVSTDSQQCDQWEQRFQDYQDLFFNFKVDLILTAHLHSFERQYPLYNSIKYLNNQSNSSYLSNPEAPIYILQGSPGNSYFTPDKYKANTSISISVSVDPSVGLITIFNQTHLYFEQISTLDQSVIDSFYLSKEEIVNPPQTDDENNNAVICIFIFSVVFVIMGAIVLVWLHQRQSHNQIMRGTITRLSLPEMTEL